MIYTISALLYIFFLLLIGLYFTKKVKNEDDFIVAGRKANVWMLTGTLICTWIGSGSLFGTAGLAFRTGISEIWFSSGAWIGILVIYFIANKVRDLSQYTLTDILEKKYGRLAKILASITIIIAYLVIAGYQFKGGGRLISIITEGSISPETGTLLTALFIITFTCLAGMVSIIALDVINGSIMIIAIFTALPLAISRLGGVNKLVATIQENSPSHLEIMGGHHFLWVVALILPTFLLLLSESSMYQKFSSAKDSKTAKKAVFGMLAGVVTIEIVMALLAIVGYALYHHDQRFVINGIINKPMAEEIILRIGFEQIPAWAGVLLLNAGIAIILSTGNTFLMVTSTNLSRDFFSRLTEKYQFKKIHVQRFFIVVLGIMAYLIVSQFQTILEMAFISYTMIGASLTPALLASFFWKKVTKIGGIASILAGMVSTLFLTLLNQFLLKQEITFTLFKIKFPFDTDYIAIPAACISVITLILISLLTCHKKTKEDQ